jgi:hypothetical protein
MKHVRITLVALMALFGAMLVSRAATAMPVSGLIAAANEISTDIQDVRWWRSSLWLGMGMEAPLCLGMEAPLCLGMETAMGMGVA